MTVAVAIKGRDFSSKKRVFADLTFSSTYATGGEAPTNGYLKELGLSSVDFASLEVGNAVGQPTLGILAKYEYSTNKVTLWRTDAVDDFKEELPNGTSIANIVIRGEFVGDSR